MAGTSNNEECPNGSAVYQGGMSLWLSCLEIWDTQMAETSSNDVYPNVLAV